MSMVDVTETERKIAERIDPAAAGALELSQQAGGLGFSNMAEAMQFAKIMAISGFTVPKHLRGNVGACMAITIQAVEWRLSPFAVANKSYLVNDRLAYESQLIQAVVLQRAPIKGRFSVEFTGEGDKRRCTVTATLKEGGEKNYTSPEVGKIPIKNSPLWKNDPDQQLFYYSGRALCRRHFPDVLLGIYTPDELYEAAEPRRGPEHARDVTPQKLAEEPDTIAAGGNCDPPHIKQRLENDPEFAKDWAAFKAGDYRDPSKNPPHDPETGEVQGTPATAPGALDGERKDAGVAQPPEAAPASDPFLDALLAEARAKAKESPAAYKKWHNRLSEQELAVVKPHLDAVLAEAAGG